MKDLDFQVGDKVWHPVYGNGVVDTIGTKEDYPILVSFGPGHAFFTVAGKFDMRDNHRALFHGHNLKITGEVPPKRSPSIKEMREKIHEFMTWKNNELYKVHKNLSWSIYNTPDVEDVMENFTDMEVEEVYIRLKNSWGRILTDVLICPWCIVNKVDCSTCSFCGRYGRCTQSDPDNLWEKITSRHSSFVDMIGESNVRTKLKELFT